MSQPSPNEVRAQLTRILASPSFQAHPRAASFLAHVVEKAVTGRAAEIKQSTIGCEVFGRPATYEPRQDAIVRSVARVLREKLNDYYAANEASDLLRIELPKGSYVPLFHPLRESPGKAQPLEREARRQPRTMWSAAPALGLFLAASITIPNHIDSAWPRTVIPADVSALYREARKALRSGDYVRARPLLAAAESAAPRDALIHSSLSRDLQALGKSAAALDEARQAVADSGGLPPTQELEIEAVFRMASGEYSAATSVFAKLAQQYPEDEEYLRSLAYSQLASGDPHGCMITLSRSHISADAQAGIAEALCYAMSGRYLEALGPVRRAEDAARKAGQRETYAHARLLEAGLLMSTPQRSEASAARSEARRICTAIGDNSCVIHALRQEANQKVGERNPKDALTAYRTALEMAQKESNSGEVMNLLEGEGVALMELDDFPGASAALTESMLRAHQVGLSTAEVRLHLVELALTQSEDARAVILAEQAERDARSVGAHVTEAAAGILRGRALLMAGDLHGCAVDLANARHLIDKFHLTAGIPRTWRIASANLSRALGRLQDADRLLQVQDDPGDPPADTDFDYRLARLELLLDEGRYEQAEGLARDTLARLDGGGDQSACILVTALLSDAYGYAGQISQAARMAAVANSMLTTHTAPFSRKTALVSTARWHTEPVLTASAR